MPSRWKATLPLSSMAPRACSSGPSGPSTHGGLERRVLPQLRRVDRLDVVVAVDEGDRGVGVGAAATRRRRRARPAVGQISTVGKPVRRSASASHAALAATSGACAGSAEIDGMRSQASRSACRSSRWARTNSRSGLVTAATVVPRAPVGRAAASVRRMPGELLQVDVGDLTFDVRVDGPEDGRPVLLLHGFPQTSLSLGGGDAAAHAGRAAHLRARPARLLPRRPARTRWTPTRLPNLAQVTADLMTALDVPVADVVGHDWGANVAWALAGWHPDRVRSLTAVSVPHPAAYTVAFRPTRSRRSGRPTSGCSGSRARPRRCCSRTTPAGCGGCCGGEATPACRPRRSTSTSAVLSAPGALTAALNWYRAMSSATRVDPVGVPTTYVWSDGDVAIGPDRRRGVRRLRDRRLPVRRAARRHALDPRAGAGAAGPRDPGPGRPRPGAAPAAGTACPPS